MKRPKKAKKTTVRASSRKSGEDLRETFGKLKHDDGASEHDQGMSRDWFAGQALAAIATGDPTLKTTCAAMCYALADEMLKVREWAIADVMGFIAEAHAKASTAGDAAVTAARQAFEATSRSENST